LVTVESDPQAEPPNEDVAEFLFSGARELLFNVVKHAGICEVKVRLSREDDGRMLLAVSDAGVGVDPALLDEWNEAGGGFGLFSLRERLEAMGGSLEIKSAPGQGIVDPENCTAEKG
jgi:signal transduction histidine kinase